VALAALANLAGEGYLNFHHSEGHCLLPTLSAPSTFADRRPPNRCRDPRVAGTQMPGAEVTGSVRRSDPGVTAVRVRSR
jgi:hypothetical protein